MQEQNENNKEIKFNNEKRPILMKTNKIKLNSRE